jgi:hypothetical protein
MGVEARFVLAEWVRDGGLYMAGRMRPVLLYKRRAPTQLNRPSSFLGCLLAFLPLLGKIGFGFC